MLFLIIILTPVCILVIYAFQSSIAFTFLDGLSYEIPRELGGTGLALLLIDCAIAHLQLNCRSVTCLKEIHTRLAKVCILLPRANICLVTVFCTRYMVEGGYTLRTVSTDLSNLVPLALGLINVVVTFTSVYNPYLLDNDTTKR